MNRRLTVGLVMAIIAVIGLAASRTHAASPTNSTTPLLIQCDVTVHNQKFCLNATDINCTEGGDAVCPKDKDNQVISGICQEQAVFVDNPCTLTSFFNQFIYLAQWGLSFVVLLAVLMMIYGGFQWITAGGRSSKIEEGKRIFIGTLVGLAISFTAYVIINFTITAVTRTTATTYNPFAGPIATIFGGKPEQQVFSGSGSGVIENRNNCRSNWDVSCNDQIYCADPGKTPGQVAAYQRELAAKNCDPGAVDSCFGAQTATAVRKFQLANSLEPTGIIDSNTAGLLTQSTSVACTDPLVASNVTSVMSKLPSPQEDINSESPSLSPKGCCVIRTQTNPGSAPLFCSDNMSARTCASLGGSNQFYPGVTCALDARTRNDCGFCHANDNKCFGQASQYWCQSIASMSYVVGAGQGNSLCGIEYFDTLRTTKWP